MVKLTETENRVMVARGWKRGEGKLVFIGDGNILDMDGGDGGTTL